MCPQRRDVETTTMPIKGTKCRVWEKGHPEPKDAPRRDRETQNHTCSRSNNTQRRTTWDQQL